jgi:hypothetical protein
MLIAGQQFVCVFKQGVDFTALIFHDTENSSWTLRDDLLYSVLTKSVKEV